MQSHSTLLNCFSSKLLAEMLGKARLSISFVSSSILANHHHPVKPFNSLKTVAIAENCIFNSCWKRDFLSALLRIIFQVKSHNIVIFWSSQSDTLMPYPFLIKSYIYDEPK